MQCDPASTDRINSFSLVGYVPGRLGDFLTRLREELVSGCVARSHVTVLPPRPLFVDTVRAKEDIRTRVAPFAPLEIELPRIRIFEQTSVIFADIGTGRDALLEMHDALNSGIIGFNEPFPYHPHITLAQGIDPDILQSLFEHTKRRWQESAPTTSFEVESLTFVQNTAGNVWIDLADCELRGTAAVPVG